MKKTIIVSIISLLIAILFNQSQIIAQSSYTNRTKTANLDSLADNTTGNISPENLRDAIGSVYDAAGDSARKAASDSLALALKKTAFRDSSAAIDSTYITNSKLSVDDVNGLATRIAARLLASIFPDSLANWHKKVGADSLSSSTDTVVVEDTLAVEDRAYIGTLPYPAYIPKARSRLIIMGDPTWGGIGNVNIEVAADSSKNSSIVYTSQNGIDGELGFWRTGGNPTFVFHVQKGGATTAVTLMDSLGLWLPTDMGIRGAANYTDILDTLRTKRIAISLGAISGTALNPYSLLTLQAPSTFGNVNMDVIADSSKSSAFVFKSQSGTDGSIIISRTGNNWMGLGVGSVYKLTLSTTSATFADSVIAPGFRSTSDSRLKTEILDSPYGLSDIMKLRPVTYNLHKDAYEDTIKSVMDRRKALNENNQQTLATYKELAKTIYTPKKEILPVSDGLNLRYETFIDSTEYKNAVITFKNTLPDPEKVYPIPEKPLYGDTIPLSKQKVHGIGLLAQEVKEVIPEAVPDVDTTTETYSLCYDALIPVLIKAVQEQQAQIKALEARINKLEGVR